MVLLSAHLQGFIEEVYAETARRFLRRKVWDIAALIDQATNSFSNPQPFRIHRLFSSIGFSGVMNSISWQRCSNDSVKRRLNDYLDTRNAIAHGTQPKVHKAKVQQFRKFVELFARKLDENLGFYMTAQELIDKRRKEIEATKGT